MQLEKVGFKISVVLRCGLQYGVIVYTGFDVAKTGDARIGFIGKHRVDHMMQESCETLQVFHRLASQH